MRELAGQVAVVTGGARGLGEAICRSLGSAGVTVVVGDVRTDLAGRVAADVCEQGGRAISIPLDVSDAASAAASMRDVMDRFGRVDVLVNNAAIDLTVSVDELSVADWDRIMAVNLRGPFVMSKLALGLMAPAGRGHIVNIASTASKRAWANASVYHASKWGLLGFSHALHVEARAVGIKVTAVVCGGMRTPFLLDRFPDIDVNNLQEPQAVADTIRFVLSQPANTVIPEIMVLPMRETSWP